MNPADRPVALLERSAPLARHHRRRHPVRAALVVGVVLVLAGTAGYAIPRWIRQPSVTVCTTDALQATAVAGLVNFAGWLSDNRVPGYIGEVGWPAGPDGAAWASLANAWYRAADALALPVTAWAAGKWPASYSMAVYRHGSATEPLNTAGPQASVVAAHPSTSRYLRGVVVASGSFGAADSSDSFSSSNPGRYGYDYSYESPEGYLYLASQGVRLVRLTVSWERIQPVPGGPLNTEEIGRLRQAVSAAGRAGLKVIVDLHNYGQFALGTGGTTGVRRVLTLGTPELPVADLAEVWSGLARGLAGLPAIAGFDILNEPVNLAQHGLDGARLWESASQLAVDAIRSTGSHTYVIVTGYGTTSPALWGRLHPRAWIRDPLHRVVYEAHAYFDSDSSGHYQLSYAAENARAQLTTAPRCQTLRPLSGGLA
jgi:Cellulase (glycosyl hydrolase family 5)